MSYCWSASGNNNLHLTRIHKESVVHQWALGCFSTERRACSQSRLWWRAEACSTIHFVSAAGSGGRTGVGGIRLLYLFTCNIFSHFFHHSQLELNWSILFTPSRFFCSFSVLSPVFCLVATLRPSLLGSPLFISVWDDCFYLLLPLRLWQS